MDLYEELGKIVDAFTEASLDYAVCGGVAVAFHGYPRFTKDIDVLMREADVPRSLDLLDRIGYTERSGKIPFEKYDLYRTSKVEGADVLTVDLIAVSSALQEAWEQRMLFAWEGRTLRVVSGEGLAAMKRMAGRSQDLLDLEKLGFADESTDDIPTDEAS